MNFRDWLAAGLTFAFISVIVSLLFKSFPSDNRELLVYLVGQLSGFVGTALALYFGANKHDEQATEQRAEERGKTLDTIKTLTEVVASSPMGDGPSGKAGDPVHVQEEGK